MKVSITTGRITGLKGEKFYCCRNCYKWLITFAETSQANFCNSVNVYLGECKEEAEKFLISTRRILKMLKFTMKMRSRFFIVKMEAYLLSAN